MSDDDLAVIDKPASTTACFPLLTVDAALHGDAIEKLPRSASSGLCACGRFGLLLLDHVSATETESVATPAVMSSHPPVGRSNAE